MHVKQNHIWRHGCTCITATDISTWHAPSLHEFNICSCLPNEDIAELGGETEAVPYMFSKISNEQWSQTPIKWALSCESKSSTTTLTMTLYTSLYGLVRLLWQQRWHRKAIRNYIRHKKWNLVIYKKDLCCLHAFEESVRSRFPCHLKQTPANKPVLSFFPIWD